MSIRILTLADLEQEPDAEWLVDDLFQRDTFAAISGNRNSFKTFVILDIGLCIAAGIPWQGHPVRQGNVLHIVGEGGRGIKRRERAWFLAHGLTPADVGERWRCTVKAVDLMVQTDELITDIRMAYPGGKLDMLVIDTFARNCSGDENSTDAMKMFVKQSVDRIIEAFPGLCLVLIHHNSRQGAFRGNSSVDGALNTLLTLTRTGDEVVAHLDKQKDAEEAPDFTLRQVLVPMGDGGKDGMVLAIDLHADPDGDKVLEILDAAGDGGLTRKEAEQVCVAKKKMFSERKFDPVWKRLEDNNRIVPADGLPKRPRGTKWRRNVELLDLSFTRSI